MREFLQTAIPVVLTAVLAGQVAVLEPLASAASGHPTVVGVKDGWKLSTPPVEAWWVSIEAADSHASRRRHRVQAKTVPRQ